MDIKFFFDAPTGTMTYLISDLVSSQCAIIDPILDFDLITGQYSYDSANKLIKSVKDNNLELALILETHIHADHLSGASYLKTQLGGKVAISNRVVEVLDYWQRIFQFNAELCSGSQFDLLLEDNQKLTLGENEIAVMHTPGHTPACVTYLINDCAFVGDTLFTPTTLGCARCDFPGGSAEHMYASLQKLLALPEANRIYIGHAYPKQREEPAYCASVAEHKENNIMIGQGISKQDFIDKRQGRDAQLSAPKLLMPSLQVNLLAGEFAFFEPHLEQAYLKIPLSHKS